MSCELKNAGHPTLRRTALGQARTVATCALLILPGSLLLGFTIPSDGTDGAFAPVANTVVDLSQAETGDWNMAATGQGVYDPSQWAVVFKYASVNIPAGVTVSFSNHPSRAPVIWLVQGDVTINGTISLNGSNGHTGDALRTFAEPGPGGFRGGRGSDAQTIGAGGLGPGGASYGSNDNHASSGGGYGSPGLPGSTAWGALPPGSPGIAYGNAGVYPLIGGSGAAGCANGSFGKGGGAGGGAILIATPGTLTLNGQIRSTGGNGTGAGGSNRGSGGGSGGGIRLIADSIAGTGTLRALGGAGGGHSTAAYGGNGGVGRIRVEAFVNELTDLGNPAFSLGVPEAAPRIFRDPAAPAIRSVSLDGQPLPVDPRARMTFPETDVTLAEAGPATLLIEAANVPLPPDGEVIVRVVRRSGRDETHAAVYSAGTLEASTWTAEVDIASGFSTVQVHARFPEPE